MAKLINFALTDLMLDHREVVLAGEDVGPIIDGGFCEGGVEPDVSFALRTRTTGAAFQLGQVQ